MRYHRAGGFSVIVGLALLFVPLYRDTVGEMGLTAVVDPIAAVGLYGGYPVGVGSAAIAIGSAVLWGRSIEQPASTTVLAGGTIGALMGVIAIVAMTSVPVVWAMQLGFAGAAPGFAAVYGAATEHAHRRLGVGLVTCALFPFTGTQFARGVGQSGLAGAVSFLVIIAVLLYTSVLSYPFYRLGRLAA